MAELNSLDPRKVSGLRKEEQTVFSTKGFCPFRALRVKPWLLALGGLWTLGGAEVPLLLRF